jgi:hypothetical protein
MLFVQVLRFSVQKLSTVSDVLTSVTRTPLVPTNQQLHVQFQELKHSLVGAVLRPLVSVIGRILHRKNTSLEELQPCKHPLLNRPNVEGKKRKSLLNLLTRQEKCGAA